MTERDARSERPHESKSIQSKAQFFLSYSSCDVALLYQAPEFFVSNDIYPPPTSNTCDISLPARARSTTISETSRLPKYQSLCPAPVSHKPPFSSSSGAHNPIFRSNALQLVLYVSGSSLQPFAPWLQSFSFSVIFLVRRIA